DRLPVRLRHRHAHYRCPDSPRPVPRPGGNSPRQSRPGGGGGTHLPRPVQGARTTAGAEGGGSGTTGSHRWLVGHFYCAGAHAVCVYPGGTGRDPESAHLAYPVGARWQSVTIGELRGAASAAFEGNLPPACV